MTMLKCKRWILRRDLAPELLYAKVTLVDVNIVKKHHRSVTELGQPSFKVMTHGIKRM